MLQDDTDLWRSHLETLFRQFDTRGGQSAGLYHLMVEADDDHRDRLSGPAWFQRDNPDFLGGPPRMTPSRWQVVCFATLPSIEPTFREVDPESAEADPSERIVHDGRNRPRAAFVKQRLRFGYLCGSGEQADVFQSLATSAVRCLRGVPEQLWRHLPNDLHEIFRPRPGLEILRFGKLNEMPSPVSAGWQAVVYTEDDGVVIFCPKTGRTDPNPSEWLLLLHQIGWLHAPGLPLVAERRAWQDNASIPLEWANGTADLSRLPWPVGLESIPGHSFYSVLGGESAPIDVFVASAVAIQFLLALLRPPPYSTAMRLWTEKLRFLQEQEPITVDPAMRFALKKQMEEAKAKIRELGGRC